MTNYFRVLFIVATVFGFMSATVSLQGHAAENAKTHVTIQTELEVFSIAAIPAIGHRGVSHIVVGHGAEGVSIYNVDGVLVWRDKTVKADLVSHYQGHLVVYAIDGDTSRLERYRIRSLANPQFIESHTPSPIAATTLQRTNFSVLGPVQLNNNKIMTAQETLEYNETVVAVAAANYFPPLVAGRTVIVALAGGDILVQNAN